MAEILKADELIQLDKLNKDLQETIKLLIQAGTETKDFADSLRNAKPTLETLSTSKERLARNANLVSKAEADVIKANNQAAVSQERLRQAQIRTEQAEERLIKTKKRGTAATNTWSKALDSFAFKFNSLGNLIGGAMLGAMAALVQGIRTVISANVEFDKNLKSLQAITGATSKEIEYYAAQAKEMSKVSTQSAADILKAYEAVGSAVPILLKNKEALAEVTKQAIILSEASGGKMGVEDAARAMTAAMNQFELAASDASKVINTLAAGELAGAATSTELADSLKNVGAVAKGSNLTLEQTVALLEVLAEKQMKGEEAGTKLRGAITKLKDAGLGYASGTFVLRDALTETNGKLKAFGSDAERDAYLIKTFGLENQTAGAILLDNVDKYDELTVAVTGTTTALEQQKIQNESAAAQGKKLGNEIISTFSGAAVGGAMATFTKGLRYTWLILKEIVMGVVVAGNAIYDVLINSTVAVSKLIGKNVEWSNTTGAAMKLMADMWKEFDKPMEEAAKGLENVKIKTEATTEATKAQTEATKEQLKAEKERLENIEKIAKAEREILNDAVKESDKAQEESFNNDIKRMEDGLDADYLAIQLQNEREEDLAKYRRERAEQEEKDKEEAAKRDQQRIEEEKERRQELYMMVGDLGMAGADLSAALNDRKIQGVETERDIELSALEEKYNTDVEKAGKNEKQKARLKKQYEKEKQRIEEEAAKETGKRKKKQFIFDKVIAMITAGINTALGISNALGMKPPGAGIPLAIAHGSIGVLQLAAIAATPIPEFAKGVQDFAGGLADVGDGGKPELINTPDNRWFISPATRTRVFLPKGSNVFDGDKTEMALKGGITEAKLDELIKATKEKKAPVIRQTNITGHGIERVVIEGSSRMKYVNKYF